MILYFPPDDYERVEGVLVQNGASRHGRGLLGKRSPGQSPEEGIQGVNTQLSG